MEDWKLSKENEGEDWKLSKENEGKDWKLAKVENVGENLKACGGEGRGSFQAC